MTTNHQALISTRQLLNQAPQKAPCAAHMIYDDGTHETHSLDLGNHFFVAFKINKNLGAAEITLYDWHEIDASRVVSIEYARKVYAAVKGVGGKPVAKA